MAWVDFVILSGTQKKKRRRRFFAIFWMPPTAWKKKNNTATTSPLRLGVLLLGCRNGKIPKCYRHWYGRETYDQWWGEIAIWWPARTFWACSYLDAEWANKCQSCSRIGSPNPTRLVRFWRRCDPIRPDPTRPDPTRPVRLKKTPDSDAWTAPVYCVTAWGNINTSKSINMTSLLRLGACAHPLLVSSVG